MRNVVKSTRWVIVVRCLSCQHRGIIAEGNLVRFGIKPGAPLAQFVKRLRRLGIMSFEAPPGKRSMFGYLTIDLLNSVSGMSISERLQPQPYTCKWLVAFIASPLTAGLLGQE